MNFLRTAWVLLNLVIATGLLAPVVIVAGGMDKRKRCTGKIARFWARWVMASCGIRAEAEGLEHIDPGQKYIFMGNHESALDIPIAMASLPVNLVFLAKKELFRVPVFGWALRAAGMVRVDRQNRNRAKKSVDRAIEAVHSRDVSIIIYPEGTRSTDDRLLPFKKGGFLLAIRSGLPVIPITVLGAQSVVSKNSLILKTGKVRFVIDAPIPTDQMDESQRDMLLSRVRDRIQSRKTDYLSSEFTRHVYK